MLKVEIWSDVVCPFCYMGKRRFEKALSGFEHKDEVEVTWRSFQLDPDSRPRPGQSVYEYLADRKGIPAEQSRKMHEHLVAEAAKLGLRYDFDAARIANTFDAHRLTHMARERGLQAGLEERLFAAYFTEGKDIGDREVLVEVGAAAGLDATEVRTMLAGTTHADEVRAEMREAQELGANGVPFFVFDRTFAVSGAQPSELFLEALQKAWEEKTAAHTVQESAR